MEMLIGGNWVTKDKVLEVRNPFDDSVVDTVPRGTPEDAVKAIAAAVEGARLNRRLPVHARAEILHRVAHYVEEHQEDFARTIATEGSKTIREARKEVIRCINTISLAAEEAKRLLGETIPFDSMPGSESRVGYFYRMPIGVIVAITPFNDPLNLVAHKLGPAIAGGNSVVLKPATVTPISALKLAEAFLECGLPPQILSVVTGSGSELGPVLVQDERVRMISFTGGVEAGRVIVQQAGLKKIGMELGSNSPVIILSDANLERAVETCVSGAFWAAGQNCIGVQRIYVQNEIYDSFAEAFVSRTKTMKVGYQLDESTDMGPMITKKEAERVMGWVEEAVTRGARVLTGNERSGTLVAPTVLEKVPADSRLDCQEVFGPVVSLYPIRDLKEGIEKANHVPYGLHAAIFTENIRAAFQAVHELEAGAVIINDSTDYRLDAMPFGGVKNSGLGREGVKFSLQEMTEPKVVCFNFDEDATWIN